MPLREYKIASRPFAAIGTAIRTNKWNTRLEKLHAQLLTDIPSLKSLKASEIDLSFEPTATNVNLTAFLLETPQRSLPSGNYLDGNDDLFIQDVNRVMVDQQGIEDRITLAISPTANPTGNPEIIEIRRRVRTPKTQGPVIIWTAPESTTLPLFERPKVLPLGSKSTVHVRVNTLTASWAEVVLLEDLPISTPNVIKRGTTITLKRAGEHGRPPSGARLQYAMDTKADLEVEVAIVLEWENGKPACLELIRFVDELVVE